MLILSNDDVSALLASLDVFQIIDILNALARALGDDTILRPLRQSFKHPQAASTTTLIMPTFASSCFSTKIVSLNTTSESKSTSLKGSLLLFSPDGSLDAVLNASEFTGFRTALASMIPFVLRFFPELVSEEYNVVGDIEPIPLKTVLICGAGLQAEWAIKLLLILCAHGGLGPPRITIINRSLDRAQALIKKVLLWYGEKILPVTNSIPAFGSYQLYLGIPLPEFLVSGADAIFCCTPSRDPLFSASELQSVEALKKTRYISAIGSYTPDMKEVHPNVLVDKVLKFSTLVDTIEGCEVESGEIIGAHKLLSQSEDPNATSEPWMREVGVLWHEAKESESLRPEIRRKMMGNVFYKSVGTGTMDLVVAKELVRIVRDGNCGVSGVDIPSF